MSRFSLGIFCENRWMFCGKRVEFDLWYIENWSAVLDVRIVLSSILPVSFLAAAIVFALLFNKFFWFPECLLLFWIFQARNDAPAATARKSRPVLLWGLVLAFAVSQLFDFQALHPKTWSRQKHVAYDYGFWPPEKNERGAFSWTRSAAGKYVTVSALRDFAIICAAPPEWLQKETMAVELFWRGKSWQRVRFSENQARKFQLPGGQEGFLKLRMHPTFNLKALKMAKDARELGVQFKEIDGLRR